MTDKRKRKQERRVTAISHVDRKAFTVDEFCAAFRVSRRHFYDMQKEGTGPRILRAGEKPLVTVEAAAAWRAEREAATPQAA